MSAKAFNQHVQNRTTNGETHQSDRRDRPRDTLVHRARGRLDDRRRRRHDVDECHRAAERGVDRGLAEQIGVRLEDGRDLAVEAALLELVVFLRQASGALGEALRAVVGDAAEGVAAAAGLGRGGRDGVRAFGERCGGHECRLDCAPGVAGALAAGDAAGLGLGSGYDGGLDLEAFLGDGAEGLSLGCCCALRRYLDLC